LVALATSSNWPDLSPDDRSIGPALAKVGVDTEVAIWTDGGVDWERFDLIVVRSCWDYHDDLPRWLSWLDAMDAIERSGPTRGRLWNPPSALRWNSRKTYLRDLAERGVPIVPTTWLTETDLDSWATLKAALDGAPWDELVCKPAVSAGALGTFRVRRGELTSSQRRLTASLPGLKRRGPLLVQPFLREISDEGEWSLLFFDGRLSHAVLKRPARGDFRVQEKHGGSTIAACPPAPLVVAAERALSAAGAAIEPDSVGRTPLLYARVDLVLSVGQTLLMEMEITEPGLFLETAPGSNSTTTSSAPGSAVDRFATAIGARIAARQETKI
jgi:glutathione synthase/RimK-type ligase-like ATP-grasp enzyme